MSVPPEGRVRIVSAVNARRELDRISDAEASMSAELRENCSADEIQALFQHFASSPAWFDALMRQACLRSLVRRCGTGLRVGAHVSLRHPETFELGDGVFIGDQAVLQGRFDGRFVVGDRTWIGPQCFLDARDLVLGRYVGLGPGTRILGSEHTGHPLSVPVITTDLAITPVRVGDGADVGTGAILLPGVTIGEDAIIGAGAVVNSDIPARAKAAGVPARVIGWRDGTGANSTGGDEK
jgi:acetyltransferase-like isoleucine patch superfamily enzyme